MIIESLITISERENSQVFITTHTPEIAQMVATESLIMIAKDDTGLPKVIKDREVKVSEIVNTLGILPTIHSSLVICLEGPNDVNFIKNLNQNIPEFKEIIDLEHENISLYSLGGSRLIDWINLDHFKHSNTKEFHLYDGDIEKYRFTVEKMNEAKDGRRLGLITQLREMENYIPRTLIEAHFVCDLSEFANGWSNFDVPLYLKDTVMQHIIDSNIRENAIKGILNGKLTKEINVEQLKEHGVYEEILGWFKEIRNIYKSTGISELSGV